MNLVWQSGMEPTPARPVATTSLIESETGGTVNVARPESRLSSFELRNVAGIVALRDPADIGIKF